jgi:hypothetical protein
MLWISLGTFIQISAYPAYNYLEFDYNSVIYNFLWWITFPFNLLLFAILYFEKINNIYILIIILQSIKVFVYGWLLHKMYSFIKSKTNRK